MEYQVTKRAIDFTTALIGIIILSPIFLLLIVAIKIDSKGPIFFKQSRVGKNKKQFKILKFRTMNIDTPKDSPTHLLINPERYITKVGKVLRKTSLDELPQLFNIVFGDMSLVGPRPALWNQYDLIKERDKYNVNSILPGLTGWAQVNGRDELPIRLKARLDGQYLEKIGFRMDMKCIYLTFFIVLRKEGVVEGGTGTLDKTIRDIEETF